MNIFLLILIGISLSMDTFSLSLSIGTYVDENKKFLTLSIIVGLFHFFMPLLGNILNDTLKNLFYISNNYLIIFIFSFIAISMFIDLFNNKEKKFILSLINMIIFAFSVSIDSFTIGVGLKSITNSLFLGYIIFMIISFIFTLLGLYLGKFLSKKVGKISKILGLIIILILIMLKLNQLF